MISIITINYNNKTGLENTVKSVVNQTFINFEYIVIDGDSNDGSKAVIEKYKSYFCFTTSEPDSGVYNAMNKGIKAAKGKYLLFLNSGDTLYDKDVLKNVSIFLKSNIDIYYGNLKFNTLENPKVYFYPSELSFNFFYEKSLGHPATFIKRSLFDKFGVYNEHLKIVADWEFFTIVLCKYNATYQYINYIIANFEADGLSSNPLNKELIKNERTKSLSTHFPMFYKDYESSHLATENIIKFNKLLKNNRFKMLLELESSSFAKKINSVVLRILLKVFRNKNKLTLK